MIFGMCLASRCNNHVGAFQSTINHNGKALAVSQRIVCTSSSPGSRTKQSPLISASSLIQDADSTTLQQSATSDIMEQMYTEDDSSAPSIEMCKINNLFALLTVLQQYHFNGRNNRYVSRQNGNKEVENQILQLGRQGRTEEALQLYHAVHEIDRIRNLYRSKSMSLKSKGKEIDKHIVLSDIVRNKLGWKMGENAEQEISELHDLMEALTHIRPTTRLLNLAIDACARAYPVRQDMAFDLFQSACMEEKAISPNVFTFGSLLASCARNRDISSSLQLLHELESGRYPDVVPNGVIYSTVISACERSCVGACGREGKSSTVHDMVNLALELLNNATLALSIDTKSGQSSHGRNAIGVVGFNAAISTMARCAEWKMAVQLLDEMIMHSTSISDMGAAVNFTLAPPLLHVVNDTKYSHKVFFIPKPDEVTFGTVLAACERAGEWDELLRIARASREYGVILDGIALTSVLHACQQLGLADDALEYLDLMKNLEDNINESTSNGMVGRRTNGRMRKGAKQALRGPDGVAYRLAISACARSPGRWQDGLRLLDDMRASAIQNNSTANAPDVVSDLFHIHNEFVSISCLAVFLF